MRLFLQPDVILQSMQGWPVLSRDNVRVVHRLSVDEALALTFLGATGDPHVAADYCAQCLPHSNGTQVLDRVLDRYWTYLGDGPARPVDLHWLETFALDQPWLRELSRRDAAPTTVIWLVTLACNRRCPYCFYNVTPHAVERQESPADATFPLADAVRMVQEMAQIGTADLYLTGGEPLLRKDLLEVIHTAAAVRVRTRLVTKYPVDRSYAQRLRQAGLCAVTVSLDDARPREAAALAGASGYLEEAKTAITAFLEAGIPLEVNAVVTRVNIHHLEPLVQLAITLGVPKLTLSTYTLPSPLRPGSLRLVPTEGSLPDTVATLQQQYGHRLTLGLGGAASGGGWDPCGDQTVCNVGIRDVHVLPDGRVTRCRYLPGYDALIVGSLLQQTLMDIWEGAPLAAFSHPERSLYAGTACHGCGGFQACNTRGRCYYTALSQAGRLHAPDDFCQQGLH